MRKTERVHDAIIFAAKAHKGQTRKGTEIDYITHPMEVLQILTSMNADEELQIAGVLHDTVEDTEVTLEHIKEQFGLEVARLVASHSEDKRWPWDTRKQGMINAVAKGDTKIQMLVLADVVSNMRSTLADYRSMGEEVWNKFSVSKEKKSWYYSGILDAVCELQYQENTKDRYWEATGLYKELFVKYYINVSGDIMYQISAHGENFFLEKGNIRWKKWESEEPCDGTELSRSSAEEMEEEWEEFFWNLLEKDYPDGSWRLYTSKRRVCDIRIKDECLFFDGDDYGQECRIINGKDEYEFHYSLDRENTRRFLTQMRLYFGTKETLEKILRKEFGGSKGSVRFTEFCDKHAFEYKFFSC